MTFKTSEPTAFERVGDFLKGLAMAVCIFLAGVLCRPLMAPIFREVFAATVVQAQPQQVTANPSVLTGKGVK